MGSGRGRAPHWCLCAWHGCISRGGKQEKNVCVGQAPSGACFLGATWGAKKEGGQERKGGVLSNSTVNKKGGTTVVRGMARQAPQRLPCSRCHQRSVAPQSVFWGSGIRQRPLHTTIGVARCVARWAAHTVALQQLWGRYIGAAAPGGTRRDMRLRIAGQRACGCCTS